MLPVVLTQAGTLDECGKGRILERSSFLALKLECPADPPVWR